MTHPQLKHIITSALESFSEQITRVGFSLLFQAVVRVDSKYLQEEEEGEEGEAMEESLADGEEEEEPVLEGLVGHEEAEESAASRDEEEALGKRKENGKAKSSKQESGKSNGKSQAPAQKTQAKPGEQPIKQKKTS